MILYSPIITKLNIDHFRGINHLEIDSLSYVNIFAGANNSGKTSILETLKLMSNPSDTGLLMQVALTRTGVGPVQKQNNLIRYLLSAFQKGIRRDDEYYIDGGYYIQISAVIGGHICGYMCIGILADMTDTMGEVGQRLTLSVKSEVDKTENWYRAEIYDKRDSIYMADGQELYSALYASSTANLYPLTVTSLSDYIADFGKKDCLEILQSFDPEIDDISIVREDIYLHHCGEATAYGLPA